MFKRFKELDNIDKALIIITIIIMILLVINLIVSTKHICQFETVKNSGNERWFQVEERIVMYEHKINQLENMIENLK